MLAARNGNERPSTQRPQQRFSFYSLLMEQRRFVQENLSVHLLGSICHEGSLFSIFLSFLIDLYCICSDD
jgi:hypothetical protein